MTRPRIFASPAARTRAVRALAVVVLVAVAGSLLLRHHLAFLGDPAAVRDALVAFGPWTPAAFVAVQALQVVFAPIPGQVFGVAAGYLFGASLGTVYSILGIAVGSAIAVTFSRRFGRRYVERVVDPDTLARFDDLTDDRGLLGLFVAFLVPGLPDDAICFVAGLTEIPTWKVTLVAIVGRLPGFAVAAYVGAGLASDRLVEAGSIALAAVALSILGYAFRGRLVGLLRA